MLLLACFMAASNQIWGLSPRSAGEGLNVYSAFRSWRWWGILLLGWTAFALFFASQIIINRAYNGRPLDLWHTISLWLICAYIWCALSPLVLQLARRFRIDTPFGLFIHIIGS